MDTPQPLTPSDLHQNVTSPVTTQLQELPQQPSKDQPVQNFQENVEKKILQTFQFKSILKVEQNLEVLKILTFTVGHFKKNLYGTFDLFGKLFVGHWCNTSVN